MDLPSNNIHFDNQLLFCIIFESVMDNLFCIVYYMLWTVKRMSRIFRFGHFLYMEKRIHYGV
jgi:hypothetical protein